VPTAPISEILARLQDEPQRAATLADVLIDAVLATPVGELLAPARIVPAFVAGLRAGVDAAGDGQRLAARIADRQRRAVARPGPLADRLPPELRTVLRRVLRHPHTPGRELVRAVVDHAGMRALLRTILQATLLDFATKVSSLVPDTSWVPGAGIRSRLFGMAKGVASAVGAEVEHRLEDRIKNYVDGFLGRAIDMIVERATDPRFAADSAVWRSDAVLALLDLPESVLLAERRKFDPHLVATEVVAAARAVARWDRLEAEVDAVLTGLVTDLGEHTVGDLLASEVPNPQPDAWRPLLAGELTHHLRRLFARDAFVAWVTDLVEVTAPTGSGG
jgi:hypothetical protein